MMGFGLFGVMFSVVFVLVIGVFVVTIVKNLSQWHGNNQSPRLTVDAEVVSRYDSVSSHRHDNHTHHHTTFYVVFEVDSGDRMEFTVPREEYGFLVVGDHGKLTFQGTRYLSFERE